MLYLFGNGIFIFPARGTKHKFKIGIHTPVYQQLKILKNDSDFTSQMSNIFCPHFTQIVIEYAGFAFINRNFVIKRFYQGAFSASYFTKQIDKFAGIYFQINIF